MMDNNKCGENCGCDTMAQMGGHCMQMGGKMHRGFLKKVLMMLVIVAFSFWMGLQLGEMSGFIKANAGEGYRMHREMMRGDMNMMYGGTMMQKEVAPTPATPAAK